MRGLAGVVLGVGRRRLQPSDGGSVLHSEDGWGFDAQNGDLVHGTTFIADSSVVLVRSL